MAPPLALALTAGLYAPRALANGQASHVWISQRALTDMPEGELREFVSDPLLRQMLLNGSMYPDGGYGPVDHPNAHEAAETAHWEPYQDAYRAWIMETYSRPWSPEAREHIAFYLGMSAHGMGDQVFDSMFMQRSVAYDATDLADFDQFMDYILVSLAGEAEIPEDWVPAPELLVLYEQAGLAYTAQAILDGQAVLRAALSLINVAASVPANIETAQMTYPWASEHLLDVQAEGSPPVEAAVVQRYWQSNWDLLHGRDLRRPVLFSFPYDGTANHPTDATSVESWISIVFSRGLDAGALGNDAFMIEAEGGDTVPFNLDLYYGNESHVVHLKPAEDLAVDTVYTVVVEPGIATVHGETLDGWAFRFSTGDVPPDPIHDDEDWTNPDPPEPPSPPGGDGGDTDTGDGDGGGPGDADTSSGETADGGTAETDAATGCACAHGTRAPNAAWLALLAVTWRRRRRT